MKYKVLFVSALLAVTLTGCGKEKEAKKDMDETAIRNHHRLAELYQDVQRMISLL